MRSLSASSVKPPWVAADGLGEPFSPEPLNLGLTMHCVSLVSSKLSHHPELRVSILLMGYFVDSRRSLF